MAIQRRAKQQPCFCLWLPHILVFSVQSKDILEERTKSFVDSQFACFPLIKEMIFVIMKGREGVNDYAINCICRVFFAAGIYQLYQQRNRSALIHPYYTSIDAHQLLRLRLFKILVMHDLKTEIEDSELFR